MPFKALYFKTYLISGMDLMRRHTTSHCPARNSMAPIASLILFVIAVGPVINDVPLSTIAVHPLGQAYYMWSIQHRKVEVYWPRFTS